jgi:hypothetical protein
LRERLAVGPRARDERRRAGHRRQEASRLAYQIVDARPQVAHALEDRLAILARHFAHLDEGVYEHAEAPIGGHPPGARVRLCEIARVRQIGEHVTDRRRRKIDAVALGQAA